MRRRVAIGLTVGLVACGGGDDHARATPPEPVPDRPGCALPPRDCVGPACATLEPFLPAAGPGYEDVPLADERARATSTTYVRRDLMMLVKYATAVVACVGRAWPGLGDAPLALGDGSERAGTIPGTRQGRPRHPPGTHVAGRDLDLAYYQRDQPDHHLRSICPHVEAGVDQRRCVGPPTTLDAERTALLIGTLFESPLVRVIGVDAGAVPALEAALAAHCRAGRVTAAAYARVALGFEATDQGRGWYHAHHHHLHVAWR